MKIISFSEFNRLYVGSTKDHRDLLKETIVITQPLHKSRKLKCEICNKKWAKSWFQTARSAKVSYICNSDICYNLFIMNLMA